jgi:hypothetical protein
MMQRGFGWLAVVMMAGGCGGEPAEGETTSAATAVASCDDFACNPQEVCEELGGDRAGQVGCVRGNACELGPQQACNGKANAVTECAELADGSTAIMFTYCDEQECGPGADGALGCFDR